MSFLAHETQRLADMGRYPGVPHAHANKRVLADLRARLGLAAGAHLGESSVPALRRAAEELSREDTRPPVPGSAPAPPIPAQRPPAADPPVRGRSDPGGP